MKHYNSKQSILLVGKGDFSFSVCLANDFGSAKNMVATSLDSRGVLRYNYSEASDNLKKLKRMRCTLIHKVDVSTMDAHPLLSLRRFDIIVFNFPHAGFIYDDERNILQIEFHRALVKAFFTSASKLLKSSGEIHIRHKTNYPFCSWGIEELAKNSGLSLCEESPFRKSNYPGYMNKRGHGPKWNRTFPICRGCSLYKFVFNIPRAGHNLVKECNLSQIEPHQTPGGGFIRSLRDVLEKTLVHLLEKD